MPATVRTGVDDKVGTIALDNLAKRNALGAPTVREMLDALRAFEDAGVRAVVLRTAEPRRSGPPAMTSTSCPSAVSIHFRSATLSKSWCAPCAAIPER